MVDELYPGGDTVRLEGWITSNYETDQAAVAFFNDRAKTGLDLTQEKVKEYVVNASVLNTCIKLYNRASASKKLMGEKYDWERWQPPSKHSKINLAIRYQLQPCDSERR